MGGKKNALLHDQASVLLVSDVVEAARFWHEKLGFNEGSFWGDPPDFCICAREGQHVFLSQAPDPELIIPFHRVNRNLWNLYFFVENVEALFKEYKKSKAPIAYGMTDQPYGCREFGVQDPDGNVIGFGQNLDGKL